MSIGQFARLFAGVLFIVGCAQGKKTGSSNNAVNPAKASSGEGSAESLGDTAVRTQAEKPLFFGAADDLNVTCKPQQKMSFLRSEGLSSNNSYLLARFSMIGDSSLPFDKTTLPKWLEKFGLQKVVFLENVQKGVKGFVATSAQFNLVVFQGTHSLQGALTDLQAVVASASPDNIPGGMHKGFRDAYETVSTQLSAVLSAEKEKNTPTYFVGHSLGGALAVIASSEQQKAGVNVAGVVTLGQPRVGNEEFVSGFEKVMQNKYMRYVFENDPVPHLPPSASAGSHVTSIVTGTNGLAGLVSAGVGVVFAQAAFKHAQRPQTLGNPSFSASGFTSDDNWDKDYWVSNASSVGQIVQNPTSALKDSVIADHDVNRYLCGILEKISYY
ncbi:MAG: hypothetical protein RJB13_262 [Pseudomonadota bacterium]